jgi:hypothetical protein
LLDIEPCAYAAVNMAMAMAMAISMTMAMAMAMAMAIYVLPGLHCLIGYSLADIIIVFFLANYYYGIFFLSICLAFMILQYVVSIK